MSGRDNMHVQSPLLSNVKLIKSADIHSCIEAGIFHLQNYFFLLLRPP